MILLLPEKWRKMGRKPEKGLRVKTTMERTTLLRRNFVLDIRRK